MKKQIVLFVGILVFCAFLYSCEESKNTRYYNLNIELNEPIPNLKESDPLPDYLKVFINYTDTSSSTELLVPEVTFLRTDIKPANPYKLEPPLTWINKFRKGRGMLPSEYLKEDYNDLVNKLPTPKILTKAKGKMNEPVAETSDYGNNTFSLNIYKVKPDSVKALKDKITRKLLSSKGNITIKLELINKRIDQVQPNVTPINKDTLKKTQDSVKQPTKPEVIDDKKNHQALPERKPEPGIKIITANSFEEYLQRIGDPSIPYESKGNLKTGIIEKYFAGENSLVVVIEKNGTESSHQKVKVFIEDLSQRNFKFKVLDKKTDNNQKINTLNIQEQ
jgi:hypothetical protein